MTVCVRYRVIFLIDTSELNRNYIIHIQHAFRQLLQEQMSNKVAFNIIKSVQPIFQLIKFKFWIILKEVRFILKLLVDWASKLS